MTVSELANREGFKALTLPDGERKINGVYIGDLLSWVMGRAKADNAWITIMSNINVVAVASLADTACVILAEGVEVDHEVLDTAEAKNINILSTVMDAYSTAVYLSELLKNE